MRINNFKNKIITVFIECFFIFGVFFTLANTAYAIETYTPLEDITIGEFIYDDYYNPTADDCNITIYGPGPTEDPLVDETMTDEGTDAVTGWHFYPYTIPATVGEYPAYITCGSALTGDLFRLDKSFIVKAPLVTSSDISGAVTTINNNTNSKTSPLATSAELTSAVSGLATSANVTSSTGTITGAISALHNITADDVWASSASQLTAFGALAADIWDNDIVASRTVTGGTTSSSNMLSSSDVNTAVWTFGTRNLNSATIGTGSIALVSDLSGLATATNVTDATSPLATTSQLNSAVTGLATATDVTNATSPLATSAGLTSAVSPLATSAGLTSATSGLATATGLTAATSGLATATGLTTATSGLATATGLTVATSGLATATGLTDAVSGLTTTSQLASAVSPLATSANITSLTETITSAISAIPLNVWNYTTRTLTSFGTLVADVWNAVTRTLTSYSPPQVIINSIEDTSTPTIAANITITNEGLSEYEYQYEWCVVSNLTDNCGEDNNIFHALAAKKILAKQDFNTTLNATVPNPGNYYFKLKVHYGTKTSDASSSFTAIQGKTSSGGGGGNVVVTPPIEISKCGRADFNCDGKVDSIDFSILLYYWKSEAPFKNQYVDINKDNKVDSIDFSILLYEWGKNII